VSESSAVSRSHEAEGGSTAVELAHAPMVAEVLGATGLISIDRLAAAAARAGEGSIVDALVASERGSGVGAEALAAHHGLPFVELTDLTIDARAIDAVPMAVLQRVVALPYALEGGRLQVVVADPGDVQALDELRLATRYTVQLAVSSREDIELELKRVTRASEAVERTSLVDIEFREGEEEQPGADEVASDAPLARLMNSILFQAAEDGASDVHLNPTEEGLTVRYRTDGVLHDVQRIPKRLAGGLSTLVKVMAKLDIAERRKPQDGRISLNARTFGRDMDVRVATLPTVWGESTVMRLLDTSRQAPSLSELGLSPEVERAFAAIVRRPTGALLVTGPTGSGKSTTLYAALTEVKRPEINIITVEDPVEYRLPGVNQVQINPRAGLTFASALRSILRSDPDVIMVGEIRDLETAKISIESALTGHMVLSTLHTNDAPSALTRLTEMGVEPFLTGAAISGVLAQRLARQLCTHCRVPHEPTEAEREAAGPELASTSVIYTAVGCKRCGKTGYKGRVGVFQLMTMSDELSRLAARGANRDELDDVARGQGMLSLWDSGVRLAAQGLTSLDEVRRVLV
jgi:type IV pilus assembly protein PilB